jgi:predicted acetyltransferase
MTGMYPEKVQLIDPTEGMREAYLDFLQDFEYSGEKEIHGMGGNAKEDFEAFVRELREKAMGIDLADGLVAASTYWLVSGDRVIGTCNLRHRLTEALLDFGGHVGYSVRPSERRKGYATLMLKLVLEKARQLGIRRALITCDRDNIASGRVIQNNGGVLGSESHSPQSGRIARRYWIELQ